MLRPLSQKNRIVSAGSQLAGGTDSVQSMYHYSQQAGQCFYCAVDAW